MACTVDRPGPVTGRLGWWLKRVGGRLLGRTYAQGVDYGMSEYTTVVRGYRRKDGVFVMTECETWKNA